MTEVRLIGPSRVVGDSGVVADVLGPRERALLAYLALEAGRVATVDQLLEAVWGNELPNNPKHALQSAIFRLRRQLKEVDPELIVTEGSGYRLRDGATTDVARVEDALAKAETLARGDPAAASLLLSEALDAMRADLLPEFRYTDWALPHIEAFEERRLSVIGDRIEITLASGGHRAAVPELQKLVGAHPLRERFRAQLMVALYRSGRPDAALGVFADGRRVVAEELGVEPSKHLRELELAIIERSSALDTDTEPKIEGTPTDSSRPARHGLPVQLTSFIGREADLEVLLDLAGEHRFLTLTGPGGIGKTRLALELADELASSSAAGAAFVDLSRAMTDDQVWPAIASALGVQEQPSLDLHAGVVRHIGDSDTLLVVDNCEQLAGPVAESVEQLLAHCPRLRVLTTSRVPLKAAGEVVWPVSPLRPPPPSTTREIVLDEFDSMLLFNERYRAMAPRAPIDAAAVAAICAAVEGIPLAVELAAARAATMGLVETAALIGEGLGLLSDGRRTAPRRHESYAEAIRWSYDLLDRETQRSFRSLGVIRGGFDLEALIAVARLERSEAVGHLSQLVEASLISRDSSHGVAGRYRLLEPIRQFAMAELDVDERATIGATHVTHYARLAVEASEGLRGPIQGQWLSKVARDEANLLAALEHALEVGDAGNASVIAAGLGPYLQLRGRLSEGRRLLERTLQLESEGEARVMVLIDLSHLAFLQCDYAAMSAHAAAARAAADVQGRSDLVAAATTVEGLVALKQRDHAAAEELLGRARHAYRRVGNTWGEGTTLGYMGFLALDEGRLDRAMEHYRRALELLEGGEAWARAFSLTALGALSRIAGDLDASDELLNEALAISTRIDDAWGRARAQAFLARLHIDRGQLEIATRGLLEAVDSFSRMGDREDLALCVESFAELAHRRERYEEAATLISAARRVRGSVRPAFSSNNLERVGVEETLSLLRRNLGGNRFAKATQCGESMTPDDTIAYAIGVTRPAMT